MPATHRTYLSPAWAIPVTGITLALIFISVSGASAQEEVASSMRRYKNYEVSSGYYEQYEVRPTRLPPVVGVPGVSQGLFPYSPAAAQVRIRRRLADSHRGIKFYAALLCVTCHAEEAKNFHSLRANLTCRQCHGGEPIASIDHFYSPMNPIRRHAYVCAKCHEGASASFASYLVHPPPAGSQAARAQFPLLFYTYWFMFVLLFGTLAFFIPHSLLVGVREFISKMRERHLHANESDKAL
jgi:hypothetical protein